MTNLALKYAAAKFADLFLQYMEEKYGQRKTKTTKANTKTCTIRKSKVVPAKTIK